jgi:hypothetical protein
VKINSIRIFKVILCLITTALFVGCNNSADKKQSIPSSDSTGAVSQKLPVKSMHDDLLILWSAIKEMHPGYGFYTPTDSLQKAYDKAYASISTPLSESEFIDHVYPFLCKLKCGHTQIKHSTGYKPSTEVKTPHLPFEVLVRNHRAWITTRQTEKLNTGDEIISMNSIPVATIINHGYDLYCNDGYNETFNELFLSEYDGFEDACNKYYHWPGPYQLKIRTRQGILKNLTVNQATSDAGAQPSNQKAFDNYADWTEAKNTGNLPLRFFKNSSTALFETKPFSYSDTIVYKEAFRQIHQKGIKNLVLDLRHNSGGDIRVAIQLLSYLADSSFSIIKDAKSRIPNPALNHFTKYFDTARTTGFTLGFQPGQKEGSWYHIDTKPVFGNIYGPLPIAKTNHFNGNLFVLIDGATFSSGALFTAALKAQRKNVKFIGRETQGAEEGCNGMTLQELTLPNTKIRVDFPWMRVISAAKKSVPGRGIMPDYGVVYSAEDVVSKKDVDLEKAISLIK